VGVHVRFVCVSLFCLLAKKKKISSCGCRKTLKKRRERFLREKTFLSSKKVSKGRERFFFSLESETKSLLSRRAARWCDDENDE
jgi:hypothetical protein